MNEDSIYKKIGIYCIKNLINGYVYIGKASVSLGDRRDSHYSLLNNNKHWNKHLQSAWNKYGKENFEFIVMYELKDGDDINEKECEYIKIYKDLGMSYNVSDGGDGPNKGKHLSDETKRKIGEKNRINMTGKKLSEETKRKMSEATKRYYENMSEEDMIKFKKKCSEVSKGFKWSEEAKKKFSQIQKQNPNGAKYTADDVRKIRKLHEENNLGYTEISKIMNMPRGTVYNIATYRRWKELN